MICTILSLLNDMGNIMSPKYMYNIMSSKWYVQYNVF